MLWCFALAAVPLVLVATLAGFALVLPAVQHWLRGDRE